MQVAQGRISLMIDTAVHRVTDTSRVRRHLTDKNSTFLRVARKGFRFGAASTLRDWVSWRRFCSFRPAGSTWPGFYPDWSA